jgi:hypothetical protein
MPYHNPHPNQRQRRANRPALEHTRNHPVKRRVAPQGRPQKRVERKDRRRYERGER